MNKDFAKIKTTIWNSDKFYGLSPIGKLFYFYCHSNRHVNSCGCYFIHYGYIMADLNVSEKEAFAAIDECGKSGLIGYNRDQNTVYINRFFDINHPTNPKHALKILSDTKNIPYKKYRDARIQELKQFIEATDWKITDTLKEQLDTLSIGKPHIDIDIDVDVDVDVDKYNGEKEKAEEKAEEKPPEEVDPATGEIFELEVIEHTAEEKLQEALEGIFNQWWKTYPDNGRDGARGSAYRGNKQKAKEIYFQIIKKGTDHEKLINDIARGTDEYRNFLNADGQQQTQHATTWLNSRGWENDYSISAKPKSSNGRHQGYSIQNAVGQAMEAGRNREKTHDNRLKALGIDFDPSDI